MVKVFFPPHQTIELNSHSLSVITNNFMTACVLAINNFVYQFDSYVYCRTFIMKKQNQLRNGCDYIEMIQPTKDSFQSQKTKHYCFITG